MSDENNNIFKTANSYKNRGIICSFTLMNAAIFNNFNLKNCFDSAFT